MSGDFEIACGQSLLPDEEGTMHAFSPLSLWERVRVRV